MMQKTESVIRRQDSGNHSIERAKRKKKIKKNEDSIRDLWDSIKNDNICIIEVPEGEEREKKTENLLEEVMAENFPNLVKETNFQVQKD